MRNTVAYCRLWSSLTVARAASALPATSAGAPTSRFTPPNDCAAEHLERDELREQCKRTRRIRQSAADDSRRGGDAGECRLAGVAKLTQAAETACARAFFAALACCSAYEWCAAASASPTLMGSPASERTEPSADRQSITFSGLQE